MQNQNNTVSLFELAKHNSEKKKTKPLTSENSEKVDPNASEHLRKLVEMLGSQAAAGKAIGVGGNTVSAWISGELPCRLAFSLAAQKIVEDVERMKESPKPTVEQHVAVIIIDHEHGDTLAKAVKNLGGSYKKLSFTESL